MSGGTFFSLIVLYFYCRLDDGRLIYDTGIDERAPLGPSRMKFDAFITESLDVIVVSVKLTANHLLLLHVAQFSDSESRLGFESVVR